MAQTEVDLMSSADSTYTNVSVHTIISEKNTDITNNKPIPDFPANNNPVNVEENKEQNIENQEQNIENQIEDFDKLKITSGDISISSEIKINETSQNSNFTNTKNEEILMNSEKIYTNVKIKNN